MWKWYRVDPSKNFVQPALSARTSETRVEDFEEVEEAVERKPADTCVMDGVSVLLSRKTKQGTSGEKGKGDVLGLAKRSQIAPQIKCSRDRKAKSECSDERSCQNALMEDAK